MRFESETSPRQVLVHRVRVRPSDTDVQGIVHASRYSVFFEAAMVEAFRSVASSYDVLARNGVDFLLAEINILYQSPARFDELLEITVWLHNIGTTSLNIVYQGRVDKRDVVRASARYVAFSTANGAKTPIPEPVRKALVKLPRWEDDAVVERA